MNYPFLNSCFYFNSVKKIVIITAPIFLFLAASSCKNNVVETEKEILKDPREMTWTADTISIPDTATQLLPEDIIVNSPNDIWLAVWVGHGQIWHFNGKEWKVVEDIGGGVNTLVKKSDRDFWAGGYIGRYDGNNVTVANYKNGVWTWNEMALKGEIWSMCVNPSGNVYAVGNEGLFLKYSNNIWNNDTIKVPYKKIFPDLSYSIQSLNFYKDNIYYLITIDDWKRKKLVHYYLKGDLYNWSIQDSMVQDSPNSNIKWGNRGLHVSDDNELYSYGSHGIWKYVNNQWIHIYYFDGEIYRMYALSKDYILGLSIFNKIYFYNGSSWQYISDTFKNKDPYFTYYLIKIINKEIYIVGFGVINNKDIVILYHGK